MKRSTIPSSHILIQASSSNVLDTVDFAVIALTESFKTLMYKGLSTIKLFESDDSFHNVCYWASPLGYFCNEETKLYSEEIIPAHKEWTFIHLDPSETQALPIPKNELEEHQIVITSGGLANFKAYGKGSFEVYMTESFSSKELFES